MSSFNPVPVPDKANSQESLEQSDSFADSSSKSNSTLPKAKLSAFARFKTFTTSGLKSTQDPPFPPATWELSGSPLGGSGSSDWNQKAEQYKAVLEKWKEEVKAITQRERVEKKNNLDSVQAPHEGSGSTEVDGSREQDVQGVQDAPDTRTLAVKIKALIDEKFTFAGGKTTQSAPPTPGPVTDSSTTTIPIEPRNANPSVPTTPPAGGTPSTTSGSMFGSLDATLARFLSSESIMNGEVGKGLEKGRESVWAMLDKLGAIAGARDPVVNKSSVDKGKGRATEPSEPLMAVEGEEESIMICTPLQPTKDLEPEIAESEIEYVEDEQMCNGVSRVTGYLAPDLALHSDFTYACSYLCLPMLDYAVIQKTPQLQQFSRRPTLSPHLSLVWCYRDSSRYRYKMLAGDGQQTTEHVAESDTSAASLKPAPKPAPKTKTKRTFYPSSTKLSLEVTWWGYRLFLPPPILAQLSSAHIAAAKRGAMITAALKWLIDQVPLMVIPPQMRASVLMLKRVSPYLGYVGAFVAWSWGRIQTKDQGNGVVLTATWLLPIAILPAAWNFEVHGRPRDAEHGVAHVATADAATLSDITPGISSTPIDTDNRTFGEGAGVEPTTPSADKPSFLSSATHRWNTLRRATYNKEKPE
ncbi:hypothetical protein F5876DRAFT_61382 [Lentinula aff. lateritia]|uniref:Uncharacterized protein n=1 Tax=Lentinula aff. lateritia TaxID=2804960 RepID=A0ACC1UEW9_9AGAR|nr:hypothetical protein F5876DRAFT_61382 [Lentinula aff. lateritia]